MTKKATLPEDPFFDDKNEELVDITEFEDKYSKGMSEFIATLDAETEQSQSDLEAIHALLLD
jgi:hypothetical protein